MDLNAATLAWFDEQAQQGIFTCDRNLRLCSWNRWLENASGRSATEVVGRPLFEVYPEIVARRLDRFFEQALQGQSVVLSQRLHKYLLPASVQGDPGGFTQMQQSVRLAPLLANGQVVGVIGVIEDVTERIVREEELRRQIALQQELHEIDQAILTLELPQCLARVTESAATLAAAPLAAVVLVEEQGCRVAACVGCAEPGRLLPCSPATHAVRVVVEGRPILIADAQAVTPPVQMLLPASRSAIAAPLVVADTPIGALVVESPRPYAFTAVEQEMIVSLATQAAVAIQNARLHTALRESETRYRVLAEIAPIGIFMTDTAGRQIYLNEKGAQILGLPLAEALKTDWPHIIHEEDQLEIQTAWARACATQTAIESEARLRLPDDSVIWTQFHVTPYRKESGETLYIGVFSDITQRRQAEERIRFQAHLLNVVGQAVIATDLDGKIVFWNRFAEQLYGWRADEALGRDVVEVTVPHTGKEQAVEIMAALTRGESWSGEFTVQRRDGTTFPALVTDAPIHAPDGRLIGSVGVSHDISERKQAEEQLRRTMTDLARSNADLQQFAYVASHDLQEPLRMVASYVQLLSMRYAGQLDADADEFIGYAMEGAKRMQQLILDLLEYARVDTRGQPMEPTDMMAVCRIATENLQIAIAESGAQVVCDPLPTVLGDSSQLGMVMQNLIGNAIKFRRETPPRIHISARQTTEDATAAGDPAARVWLFSVRDNGIGIEPRYFERIFVIFQRLHTRREYPGTGIGLAICKKIIERHGGRIWLESTPGQGTTFYFTLFAA